MDSTGRNSLKKKKVNNESRCHVCLVRTLGRRFCVACQPLTRMAGWHDRAVRLYKSGVRPMSIAVRIGIDARTVITHLKEKRVLTNAEEYSNWLNDHTEFMD